MNSFAEDLAAARGCLYVRDFATGCWNWTGTLSNQGYGLIKRRHAHRWMYEQHRGQPKTNTLDHLCRNKRCVNPDHLEATTRQENVRRGAAAKLTWDLVALIRTSSLGNTDIARQIGVSPSTVCNVRAGRNWPEDQRPTP